MQAVEMKYLRAARGIIWRDRIRNADVTKLEIISVLKHIMKTRMVENMGKESSNGKRWGIFLSLCAIPGYSLSLYQYFLEICSQAKA